MASFCAASEKAEGERVPAAFFQRGNVVVKEEIHFAMAQLDSRNHRGTFLVLDYFSRENLPSSCLILDSVISVFPRFEGEFVDVWTTCNVIKSRANDGVT